MADSIFMHRLIIGPRKAVTVCGIQMVAYYPMAETGMPVDEDRTINCSVKGDTKITCARCLGKVGVSK